MNIMAIHLFSCLLAIGLFCFACDADKKKEEKNDQKRSEIYAPDGYAVFKKYCINCHGANGRLGLNGAKDISQSKMTQPERELLVKKGRNLMTSFEQLLSEEEVKAVVKFTFSLK